MTNNDFAPLSSDELWLCHLACVSWSEPGRWLRYFGHVQEILHANITHLDKEDPVRRRVKPDGLSEVADYAAIIGKREDSRWVHGKMKSIGVEFTIRHYKSVQGWPNSISWYFPAGFVDSPAGARTIHSLFDCSNASLSPFYAYADTKNNVALKKKESGAVNVQAELVGIFWLTYFDAHYEAFIGKEKLKSLQGATSVSSNGVTLILGETPSSVPSGLRNRIESELGPKLFVQPKDFHSKRPGQYALTFDQLRTSIQPS